MALIVEVIPDQIEGGFTARILEVPAYGEGESVADAVADLAVAVEGFIEAFGFDDFYRRIAYQRNWC